MDCYVYKGADEIGYFEDSKGRTQILTREGIYEDCEVGKSKKWIRENLRPFSKEQLKNYINTCVDGYLLWKSIKAQYFKEEKKIAEFDTNKKVAVHAEVPDSSKHRTDAGRDYCWSLGKIELEEVQF